MLRLRAHPSRVRGPGALHQASPGTARWGPTFYPRCLILRGHDGDLPTLIVPGGCHPSGPVHFNDRVLTLERHEEAPSRFVYHYKVLLEIAATDFPPEHWSAAGIRTAFDVIGNVCCIDRVCLAGDRSSVRVLLLVDEDKVIPGRLLVRNKDRSGLAGIARLRVLGAWPHDAGAPPPVHHDFAASGRRGAPGPDFGSSPDSFDTPPPRGSSFRSFGPSRPHGENTPQSGTTTRALEVPLYPSVPLWSWAPEAAAAASRSNTSLPTIIIRDLPTPVRPSTPPPASPFAASVARAAEVSEEETERSAARSQPRSIIPSLDELLLEEEHEVSLRRRRTRRKRAADSASKLKRSLRLAAKENPFYEDATSKAVRIQTAKLDLSRAFTRMKSALASSGVLERPPPARVSSIKLRLLGKVCGLPNLSELDDEVANRG